MVKETNDGASGENSNSRNAVPVFSKTPIFQKHHNINYLNATTLPASPQADNQEMHTQPTDSCHPCKVIILRTHTERHILLQDIQSPHLETAPYRCSGKNQERKPSSEQVQQSQDNGLKDFFSCSSTGHRDPSVL